MTITIFVANNKKPIILTSKHLTAMKKLLLLRLLAITAGLLCTLSAMADVAYDFVYNNLKFAITSSTTAKVVGTTVSTPSGQWSIPSTANGYNVTAIGNSAFLNCNKITRITIGSSVTTIESAAFEGCSGLERVTIYDLEAWCNVTIEGNATSSPLYYARHLYLNSSEITELTVPDGVEALGAFVFMHCDGLTKVTIPNSVTTIGWSCFNGCTNLETVILGNGLTGIRDFAFGNNNLKNVTCLGTRAPAMLESCFNSTTYQNATLTVPKGCKSAYESFASWGLFANIVEAPYNFVVNGIYYSITGSNTVKVTYRDTGYNTYSGNINIPNSVSYNGTTYQVTAIGSYAFMNSTGLTSVTIPPTITLMSEYAFYGCSNLTQVNISNLIAWLNISFSGNAWANPLFLGHHLYLNGSEVTELNVPSGITELKDQAFNGCLSLTKVNIADDVTSIGWACFNGCSNLQTVSLGANVNYISYYVFAGCTSLTSITCRATTPPEMGTVETFDNATYNTAELYVPESSISAYQAADWWKNFAHINRMTHDFVKDGIYYFITSSNTVSICHGPNANQYSGNFIIPATVTYGGITYDVTGIHKDTFRGMGNSNNASLTSVQIPNTITTIGSCAFMGCTQLTDVVVPNSVTSIGYQAFLSCSNLESITLGSGLTSIQFYTFKSCPLLTSITCLATVPPEISSETFSDEQYSSATLYVPRGSKSTYQEAYNWQNFSNIVELNYSFVVNGIYYAITGPNTVMVTYRDDNYGSYSGYVSIPSSVIYNDVSYLVDQIDEYAFRLCENLTGIGIPPSVTTIGAYAFVGCESLSAVNITDLEAWCRISFDSNASANPLSWGHYLYLNNELVTEIAIPDGITSLSSFLFFGCEGLTRVVIPNSVTHLGWSCFNSCSNLTSVTLGSGLTFISAYAFNYCTALTAMTSLATTPPTLENGPFINIGSNAMLFVPEASINAYKENDDWSSFTTVLPHLDHTLNVTGQSIHFTSSGDYTWSNEVAGERIYAKSGNQLIKSSTSTLTTTVTVGNDGGSVSFEYKAWGEGSSWDVCRFMIDENIEFSYGAVQNDWTNYTAQLTPGTHTLTWIYKKDNSVDPTGDYFAIDNVAFTGLVTITPGDVNGDGEVNITDVTSLIDMLLEGDVPVNAATDVNGDGEVNITDVTVLVDGLLDN